MNLTTTGIAKPEKPNTSGKIFSFTFFNHQLGYILQYWGTFNLHKNISFVSMLLNIMKIIKMWNTCMQGLK